MTANVDTVPEVDVEEIGGEAYLNLPETVQQAKADHQTIVDLIAGKLTRLEELRAEISTLDRMQEDGLEAEPSVMEHRAKLTAELHSIPQQIIGLERKAALAQLKMLRYEYDMADYIQREAKDERSPLINRMQGLRAELKDLKRQKLQRYLTQEEVQEENLRIHTEMQRVEDKARPADERMKHANLDKRMTRRAVEQSFRHPFVKRIGAKRILYAEHMWSKLADHRAQEAEQQMRFLVPQAF